MDDGDFTEDDGERFQMETKKRPRSAACVLAVALAAGTAGVTFGAVSGAAAKPAKPKHRAKPRIAYIEEGKIKGVGIKGLIGYSVALSKSGRVALLGAPGSGKNAGAVSVFERSSAGWRQTAVLSAGGESGKGEFGYSVSLSADGKTALIGAPFEEQGMGGAWVFTDSGSTWGQGARVIPSDARAGGAEFGFSVALAGDGEVAVVGAPRENTLNGAAWVFTGAGETWSQSGSELTDAAEQSDSQGELGHSVAISGDGALVLAGEPFENAAVSFTRSGNEWGQGTRLVEPGGGSAVGSLFGWSVAVAENGRVALAGAPDAEVVAGGAWAFKRSGAGWKPMGKKLIATTQASHAEGGNEDLVANSTGASISLSADGKTAIVGGPGVKQNDGAFWVFNWNGSSWKATPKATAKHETPEGSFARAVAIDGNGAVALASAPSNSTNEGGVWAFVKGKKKPAGKKRKAARHRKVAGTLR